MSAGEHGGLDEDGLTPGERAHVDAAIDSLRDQMARNVGRELGRLDVEVARGKALLAELEWSGFGGTICPICLAPAPRHEPDCRLDAYLHPVPR